MSARYTQPDMASWLYKPPALIFVYVKINQFSKCKLPNERSSSTIYLGHVRDIALRVNQRRPP